MWWSKGAETILRLLEEHCLERIQGAQADGHSWLARAERKLEDARTMVPDSPDSSFTLVYDAPRLACTAVLVQQGLRPTSSGGHDAVDEAIRAQFGYVLRSHGALRRRRNELQYPLDPVAEATADEAADAITKVDSLIKSANQQHAVESGNVKCHNASGVMRRFRIG